MTEPFMITNPASGKMYKFFFHDFDELNPNEATACIERWAHNRNKTIKRTKEVQNHRAQLLEITVWFM